MRTIKLIGRLVLVLFVGIATGMGSIWLDHRRETTLIAPTGPLAVGRTIQVWSDAKRPALMSPSGTKTELVVSIWYPAAVQQQPAGPLCDYLPPSLRIAVEHQRGKIINDFLTRDLSRVRPHSVCNPALSPARKTYPVVLMRAGLAGLVSGYTSIAEDLASHGYIVVGFDAPYRSGVVVLPDGKVITRTPGNDADRVSGIQQERLALQLVQAWSADLGFALDQLQLLNASASGRFSGRLDMKRIGVFGHSLGGAATLQFCHDDLRCKAGIDLDGAPLGKVIAEGVTQPFMFLLSDHRRDAEEETRKVYANIDAICDELPSDGRWRFMIRGANHYMFSDDGAMLKSPLIMRILRLFGVVSMDGRRQIEITNRCISVFFDVYLQGAPASGIASLAGFPEVETVR